MFPIIGQKDMGTAHFGHPTSIQEALYKHMKVETISLFNVCQCYFESLREYFACFNEETIMVAYPKQNMFVGDF